MIRDPELREKIANACRSIASNDYIAQVYGVAPADVSRIRVGQPAPASVRSGMAPAGEPEGITQAERDMEEATKMASAHFRDAIRSMLDRRAKRLGQPGADWKAFDTNEARRRAEWLADRSPH